jgi:multiple sugar transport system permease protein
MAAQATRPSLGTRIAENKNVQEALSGFGFITPAAIVLTLFVIAPIVFSLVVSLTNWTLLKPPSESTFIGLDNYKQLLFEDSIARADLFRALRNTIYYVIFTVPLQTMLALGLAMIANQKWLRGKGFFRTAFYLPSITSTVVTATVFLWVFNRDGIFNIFLSAVSGGRYQPVTWLNDSGYLFHNILGLFGVKKAVAPEFLRTTNILGLSLWDWISGPNVTMIGIIILNVWSTAGTMMLIFLAALQDIPAQLYEAAQVDGATKWQIFRGVTLPMLRPTTFFVITIGLIGTFQIFDQIFIIAPNNPGTTTMAYMVYRSGFRDFNAGLGAATAFFLFIIIMGFTFIQHRLTPAK